MAIPLRGDRSAWDMNYSDLHASDIENEEFLNHVPTSGSSSEGFILHSSGSGWISSDEIIIPISILEQSATPSNPPAGYVKFYAKTNNKFYALDSGGNEIEFESSGSSAGVYYFTDLLDAPSSYTDQAGKVIAVNETEDGLEFVVQTSGSGSGVTTFVALTDTPSSMSGQGLKLLRVNTGGTAIEFIDAPTVYDQLTDLSDTPANYTGAGGKILAVKSSVDGIEFIDAPTSGSSPESFIDLNDVPSAYTDQAGKVLAVNTGETGLEFVDQTSGSSGGATELNDLTDVAIATPDENEVLTYYNGEWTNYPAQGDDQNAIHDDESGEINAIATKVSLHDNDVILIEDSEATYAKKKILRSQLYETYLAYLGADFEGNAGKVIAVNSFETGFELVTPTSGSSGGAEDFTDLGDVPGSYTDQAGKILAVNSGEDALEFVDMPTSGSGSGDVSTDSIWDSKGDLAVGTGSNTASKLGVGSNGQILAANSGEATGLKWIDAPTSGSSGGGAIGCAEIATSGSGSYTWNLANGSAEIEIDGNTVISASNLSSVEGFIVFIKVTKNDANYTVEFDTDYFWFAGGVQPSLTSGSGATDVLTFACDGTYLYNIAVVKNLSDEFSPAGISNLAVWLEADSISGSNDDPIGTWSDLSGNANHFVSEDNARRPLLKTSSINGHKTLLFDNSDDSLVSSYVIGQKAYSVFIVAKAYNTTSGYHKILTQGGWWDFGQMDGSKVYMYNYNEYQSSSGLASSTFLISHYQNNGGEGTSTGEFRVNGSTVASRTDFSYPNDPLMIGKYDGDQANAYVAEVIIYEKEFSSAELSAVELYLMTKYGIS